jgi:hypothetical protein
MFFIECYLRRFIIKRGIQWETLAFASSISDFLEKNLFSKGLLEVCDEVLAFLMEAIVSSLFSIIMHLKLNAYKAEILLLEISELEGRIKKYVKSFPLIGVLERYLKVFLCHPSDTETFIKNFLSFSDELFSFSEILKVLEDKSNNVTLFIQHKMLSKESRSVPPEDAYPKLVNHGI